MLNACVVVSRRYDLNELEWNAGSVFNSVGLVEIVKNLNSVINIMK